MRLIILGMHRSGTSLVAGLTHLMGFYVGNPESVMPPAEDNPKGFWERLDVVEINDALLEAEGASWVNPLPFSAGEPSPDLGLRMDQVLEELDSHIPWLMKDPRLCVTLPAWMDRIRKPIILFVHRAALPIAHSLQRRNGLPLRYGLALWEHYTVSALRAMAPYPHYLLEHGNLLADPVRATSALFRWSESQGCKGISVPSAAQIKDVYDPELVHQRPDKAGSARILSAEQQLLERRIGDGSVLQHLGELEASDESLALLQELGGLASQSDEVSVLRRENRLLESAKVALRREQQRLEGERRRLEGEQRRLEGEQRRLSGQVKNLQGEKRRLEGEVQRVQDNFQRVRSDYATTMDVFDQVLNPVAGSKLARLIDLLNRSSKLAGRRREVLTSFDQIARILESYKRERGRTTRASFIARSRTPTQGAPMTPIPLPLRFPSVEVPKVSILVPVYNHYHTTLQCLASILEHTPASLDFEVIIADDCSNDETREIERVTENLRVYRQDGNLGFLRNCNTASSAAHGEYLLILNNDTRVQSGWLEALLESMESDRRIGLAGPKFIFPDGVLQEAGGIVWQDASGWNYGRDQDPDAPEYNYLREVDYVSGACLLIRRVLWNELGGFDERFAPAYYEDTDLAFKVRAGGLKVVYVPESEVVHLEGVSHGTDTGAGVKHYQERNRALFRDKWRAELDSFQFPNGQSVFQARDRSRNRKTILVIDHYVPQYDKDAGSRSTWQYLRLFVQQGHQVKFMGDNFIRDEPYTSELQKMGIEVLYGSSYSRSWKEWLHNAAAHIDLVYMHRPHITEKYIDFIAKLRARPRLLYFGHDLHYLRAMRQFEIDGDESLRAESDEWRRRELAIVDKVDVSFFPSALEVELLEKERPGATVKRLPLNIWPEPNRDVPSFAQRNGLLFVGGFRHPPNLDGIRWFIDKAWPSVQREIPALTLHVVGSNVPDELLELNGDRILVYGYLADWELEALYRSVRVAVVPLRYGAGVKGKVLESLFQGVPVVTTPIGAEGIAGAEDAMAVCEETESFVDAIVDCYSHEARWSQLSQAGRSLIRDQYSADAVVRLVGDDFLFPGTAEVSNDAAADRRSRTHFQERRDNLGLGVRTKLR